MFDVQWSIIVLGLPSAAKRQSTNVYLLSAHYQHKKTLAVRLLADSLKQVCLTELSHYQYKVIVCLLIIGLFTRVAHMQLIFFYLIIFVVIFGNSGRERYIFPKF